MTKSLEWGACRCGQPLDFRGYCTSGKCRYSSRFQDEETSVSTPDTPAVEKEKPSNVEE